MPAYATTHLIGLEGYKVRSEPGVEDNTVRIGFDGKYDHVALTLHYDEWQVVLRHLADNGITLDRYARA